MKKLSILLIVILLGFYLNSCLNLGRYESEQHVTKKGDVYIVKTEIWDYKDRGETACTEPVGCRVSSNTTLVCDKKDLREAKRAGKEWAKERIKQYEKENRP